MSNLITRSTHASGSVRERDFSWDSQREALLPGNAATLQRVGVQARGIFLHSSVCLELSVGSVKPDTCWSTQPHMCLFTWFCPLSSLHRYLCCVAFLALRCEQVHFLSDGKTIPHLYDICPQYIVNQMLHRRPESGRRCNQLYSERCVESNCAPGAGKQTRGNAVLSLLADVNFVSRCHKYLAKNPSVLFGWKSQLGGDSSPRADSSELLCVEDLWVFQSQRPG